MEEEMNEEKVTFDWMNIVYVLIGLLFLAGVGYYFLSKPEKTPADTSSTQNEVSLPTTTGESGEGGDHMEVTELQIEDITIGEGKEAVDGATISVNYIGTLTDGTKFDSSYDSGAPFEFTLGSGQVIEGWDKGFAGMKVGGKRKLTIPASMGYGSRPVRNIPANSTLVFEVELMDVK